jgi:hypothetical protein
MAVKHQKSAAQAEAGARQGAGKRPRIHHPTKVQKPVGLPFVASGLAPDTMNIAFVFGRLVDQTDPRQVFKGMTLNFPDPYRWAIYFRRDSTLVAGHLFTLDVYAVVNDSQGKPASVSYLYSEVDLRIGDYDVRIYWPYSAEDDLCPSNFVPYGTFSDPGTVR